MQAVKNMQDQHAIKNMTRGGQTFLNNFRMISQVLNKVLLWTLPFALLIGIGVFLLTTDSYDRYKGKSWLKAELGVFFDNKHHQQIFIDENGDEQKVYSTQVLAAPFINDALDTLSDKAWISFYFALASYVALIIGVLMWLKRSGDKQSEDRFIKGDRLGTVGEIIRQQKQQGRYSHLRFGIEQLPIPQFSEMQHFFFHGTTGSGKSTYIKSLLDYIRWRGDKAIVYDKSCSLVRDFYRQYHDALLNCFDARSLNWMPWIECRDKADYESLAEALIPIVSNQDPFWVNAARTIFAVASFCMSKESDRSLLKLLKYLLTSNIEELQHLLKGTEAETLMSEKTEKTAISIKSVLATYLKCLCYVPEGENPFSIREWVQNDEASNFLFISSLGNKHPSLRPIITAWLDIAINELLSLKENPNRRIWIILDEINSLQQIPFLSPALAESRKFGGCFVLGVQSYAQLAKLYTHDGAKEISSLLNTRFMFRIPDPDIAKWSANNLGETIVEQVQEGISYGANTMRDGVSVNRVERNKQLVNYSEIMGLDDLNCFVRLPGNYPITKIHEAYRERVGLAEAFVPRVIEENKLREEVIKVADEVISKATAQEQEKINKQKFKKETKAQNSKETTGTNTIQRIQNEELREIVIE